MCVCVCIVFVFISIHIIWFMFVTFVIVLKRCISGLPKNECPYIPKILLKTHQAFSRRLRSITYNETDFQHGPVKRSPIRFPDELTSFGQTAVNEPEFKCEDRRQLGTQILKEKGEYANSMLSRFVGNFILIFSNQTTAQEVSNFNIMVMVKDRRRNKKNVCFVSVFMFMFMLYCIVLCWLKLISKWL